MERKFENEIRNALETRLGRRYEAASAPKDLGRRVVRRRVGTAAVAVTAVLVAVASATTLPGLIEEFTSPPPIAAAGGSGLVERSQAPQNEEVVASGQTGGRSWNLYAYATELSSTGERVPGDLCEAFRFGSQTPGEDYGCTVGGNAPLTPPQFIAPTWLTPEHGPEVFFGRVSPAADRVTIDVTGGPTLRALIYPGPAEWATAYDFFVGFAPSGTSEVTLIVDDATGNELERRTLQAYPTE